jgi:alginate O-acetyltransferase complex protein AlgI
MVFGSPIFLFCFLPAAYLVYRFLPGIRSRNAWLAIASLVFYSFGQPVYLPLLLLSVVMNYLFGLLLMSPAGRGKRWPAACAVAGNLLLLGTFKYLDFFAGILNTLPGVNLPLPGLALPIGISFFTFQGLSYALDVSREPDAGTRSFGKLVLYISFFPQLIAGPIIKYHDVALQIDQRELTPELTILGLRRFITGFAKKLLIANTMGLAADRVFALEAGALDLRLAWLGAVCYTLQIYFDFSGYSDMAIGLGRMFGFTFQENFNLPYAARSIKEFWRRWHISLSSWFRDYLYIPLGGNRKGRARTMGNKIIVFFSTGLWHGANWTFVLWGMWHGLFSALEDANVIPKRLRESVLGHVYTMLVVVLGFTLFRADSLAAAGVMFSQMFAGFQFTPAHTLTLISLLDRRTVVFLIAAVLLASGLPQRLVERLSKAAPYAVRQWVRTAAYAALFALCVLNLSGASFNPFIYFQF